MSPLITIRKLLAILSLAAFVVAATSSLVPTANKTLGYEKQPFFMLATFAFALTPVLVGRKEYATPRSMAVLFVANLVIATSLVIGWQLVISDLQWPTTIEASVPYLLLLLFLIGYVFLWRCAVIDDLDLKFRQCMELAIPAALASFCFQGWLSPWLQYYFFRTGWVTPLVLNTFLATTILYITLWYRYTEVATLIGKAQK